MEVDIVTNQERTQHRAVPRLLSTVSILISQNSFSERSQGKAACSDRAPCKSDSWHQPCWTLTFRKHITTSYASAGLVSLFSVLLVFVLCEREGPVQSFGKYPIWGTPVHLEPRCPGVFGFSQGSDIKQPKSQNFSAIFPQTEAMVGSLKDCFAQVASIFM